MRNELLTVVTPDFVFRNVLGHCLRDSNTIHTSLCSPQRSTPQVLSALYFQDDYYQAVTSECIAIRGPCQNMNVCTVWTFRSTPMGCPLRDHMQCLVISFPTEEHQWVPGASLTGRLFCCLESLRCHRESSSPILVDITAHKDPDNLPEPSSGAHPRKLHGTVRLRKGSGKSRKAALPRSHATAG